MPKSLTKTWQEALGLAKYCRIGSVQVVNGVCILSLTDPAGQGFELRIASEPVSISSMGQTIQMRPGVQIVAIDPNAS